MAESPPPLVELRNQVLAVFGRDLSADQLAPYAGRLPTMIRTVRMLQSWAPRLRPIEPLLVPTMSDEPVDG